MLDIIESSEIICWEDAPRYILSIFNHTYYLMTIILMERRPVQHFSDYVAIAKHAGSYFYNMKSNISGEVVVESIIMAMVYNYLRYFVNKDNPSNIDLLLKNIYTRYHSSDLYEKMRKLFYALEIKESDLGKYQIDKNAFKPLHVPTETEVEKLPVNELEEWKQKYYKIANDYAVLEKELGELKANRQGSSDGDEISKLQQENLDLKEQVKAYEEQQQEETNLAQIDFQNKVRLDLLLRLMKKDGADLEKHGNKRRAATIMNIVTGIPIPTCKNYCSEPILSENSHKREIADINPVLQKLGMQTTL